MKHAGPPSARQFFFGVLGVDAGNLDDGRAVVHVPKEHWTILLHEIIGPWCRQGQIIDRVSQIPAPRNRVRRQPRCWRAGRRVYGGALKQFVGVIVARDPLVAAEILAVVDALVVEKGEHVPAEQRMHLLRQIEVDISFQPRRPAVYFVVPMQSVSFDEGPAEIGIDLARRQVA